MGRQIRDYGSIAVHSLIYIVGLIVIVLAVLSLFGLR